MNFGNKFSGEGSGPRLPTKNNQYINVSSTDHYEMMERMFQNNQVEFSLKILKTFAVTKHHF